MAYVTIINWKQLYKLMKISIILFFLISGVTEWLSKKKKKNFQNALIFGEYGNLD